MTQLPSVTKEAFQLVWRHKKTLSLFALLPVLIVWLFWFLVLVGIWFPEMEPCGKKLIDTKAIFLPLFLGNVLFTMAWLKHILYPAQKIGFKSYFTFDTYFFLYAGYFLCLIFLVYAFSPSILVIFPLTLILPALVCGKPFKVLVLMRQPIVFYGKLFLSLLMGTITAIVLLVLFLFFGGIALACLEGPGPLPLDRSPSGEFWLLILFMISPLAMILLQIIPLTIITLYYKKGVLVQDQKL